MNVKKVVIYSVIAVILVVFAGAGVFTLIKNQEFTNNDISFVLENKLAYCTIQGWYYLGTDAINSETSTSTYDKVTYDISDELSAKTNEDAIFPRWDVGDSVLIYNDDDEENIIDVSVVKFVVLIENKNLEMPLSVSIRDIGISEQEFDGEDTNGILCFTRAEYYYGGTQGRYTVFDNQRKIANSKCDRINGQTLNITDMVEIPVDDSVFIELTFTRNTRSQTFSLTNNFTFSLRAIEE